MQLEFLGGAREVGRAAVAVSGSGTVCLDYGMMVGEDEIGFPLPPSSAPSALVLSHAHLDHVGAAPALYRKWNPALVCNGVTYDTTKILIEDALKIARKDMRHMPYGREEYGKMKRARVDTGFFKKAMFGRMEVTLYPAGHIPGASGVMVKSDGKCIFYSGDFKLEDMRLVKGGYVPKNVHTLIIESTYAERDHPDRRVEEKRLLEIVDEVVANDERVIIPVFAVGRAQEILLILEKYANKIAFDGMARKASQIASRYGEYLADPARLQRILSRVKWVTDEKDRRSILNRYPIIVTTAGMASGGPISYYLSRLGKSECRIVFVGYLPHGTPARTLLDTGVFHTDTGSFKVRCTMTQLDLSAHAGRNELFKYIEKMRPKQVFCVHGEDCVKFAKEVEERFKVGAHAPKNGEVVKV
ncbi:MAG: MBL fold metallo-hydrolase [Candidatus Aenigmarchaeota archaeon]|nr:MBL fold metallo-hydrolase [Candidatus Aenigmarchaeota archaeon]